MSTALSTNGSGPLQQGQFDFHTLSEYSITFSGDTPEDYWLAEVQRLLGMYEGTAELKRRLIFLLSEALDFGEKAYGERHAQAIDLTRKALNVEDKTMQNLLWIARAVPAEVRELPVKFSVLEKVAGLEKEEDKVRLIKDAHDEGWTVREMGKKVKELKPQPPKPPTPPKTAVIDLESEEGLSHAFRKVAEHLQEVSDTSDPAEWSKERIKPFLEPFALICEAFQTRPEAFEAMAQSVANHLAPITRKDAEGWSDAKKARVFPTLVAIHNAARRVGAARKGN